MKSRIVMKKGVVKTQKKDNEKDLGGTERNLNKDSKNGAVLRLPAYLVKKVGVVNPEKFYYREKERVRLVMGCQEYHFYGGKPEGKQ